MGFWGALIELLNKLISIFEKQQSARKHNEKQVEVNEANEDPGAWFNDHFNGMRDKPEPANDTSKTDTDSETK